MSATAPAATRSIKLTNAAIDSFIIDGKETVIIRGVIDPSCFDHLKADVYQREIGSATKIGRLAQALESETVPDIELGMRGVKIRETENGSTVYLQDPVYIIDGLQRISAGRYLMQTKPGTEPRIGCLVHLDTTFDWERERFRILNQERSKLSVNVLLRNACPDYQSINMLFKLCEDRSFALGGRVCWTQAKLRENILTALLLTKAVAMLHSRFGPGRSAYYDELAAGLDKTAETVGINTLRDNTREFFEIIDRCFSIRRIVFSHGAPQIKGSFMIAFADVLTRFEDFWKGKKLFVGKDLERKIAGFPINDPEVCRLSGGNGKAKEMLMIMLIEHINSGKRTKRLTLSEGFASGAMGDSSVESAREELAHES